MTEFEASIKRMKSSFQAIEAAKKHTIVLETAPIKHPATTSITIRAVRSVAPKQVTQYVAPTEMLKQPAGLPKIEPAKRTMKKKSGKLQKLVNSKAVFSV